MPKSKCLVVALLAAALVGCAKDEPTALDRDAFYRPPPGTDPQRHVLEDRPGPVLYDAVSVDLLDPDAIKPKPEAKSGESVRAISPEIRDSIDLPTHAAAPDAESTVTRSTATTTGPTRAPVPSGVAVLIGGVVCEVNGSPVYADKILASLSKLLSVEARQRDERGFRAFAQHEIDKQLSVFIGAELEFAMAEQNLDTREKEFANELTARWRKQQITLAGGSLENAKTRAAADGWDFEERVQEEYRRNMVLIYYQKKVFPQAQVRADDMRLYYSQNLKTLFTEPDQAQFRVIKIDISRSGGEQQAKEKADNLRERAARGEDFAAMASSVNDDPTLMRNGGDVGWIQRRAYVLEKVEDAVWQIQPGEVTQVIRSGDAFYIAKLENRKTGRVRPFEEEAVQREITDTLRKQQITALREKQRQSLIKDAIIYPYPPDIQPVVEMAMQRYAQWAAAGK